VNNPEVGMVHPDNDPDQPKTVWAYDPHLDPALMFDSQRARVEKLIDDALASDDPATMKDALVRSRAFAFCPVSKLARSCLFMLDLHG
jgi:adenine-specific DNA-methyltransferase